MLLNQRSSSRPAGEICKDITHQTGSALLLSRIVLEARRFGFAMPMVSSRSVDSFRERVGGGSSVVAGWGPDRFWGQCGCNLGHIYREFWWGQAEAIDGRRSGRELAELVARRKVDLLF